MRRGIEDAKKNRAIREIRECKIRAIREIRVTINYIFKYNCFLAGFAIKYVEYILSSKRYITARKRRKILKLKKGRCHSLQRVNRKTLESSRLPPHLTYLCTPRGSREIKG